MAKSKDHTDGKPKMSKACVSNRNDKDDIVCSLYVYQAFGRPTSQPPASSTFSIIFIERWMGSACGAIFLDILKAFDTVTHDVL